MSRTHLDTIWAAVNRRLEALGTRPAAAGELMAARSTDAAVDPDEIVGWILTDRIWHATEARREANRADLVIPPPPAYSANTIGRHGP